MMGVQLVTKAEQIAYVFAGVLRGWLGDDEWEEMRQRNAGAGYQGDTCCASHEFCDANMAMEPAFVMITGRHPKASSDKDAALWNAAWSIAKPRFLTAGA